MPTADVTLDGNDCIVDGNFLVVHCLDLKLDAASRRSSTGGERRALVHGFNDELVLNWADDYPGGVVIRGEVGIPGKIKQGHLHLESTDLHLDHPDRRSTTGGDRRALVHGFNDELVLNWAGDYPNGVVCHGDLELQKSGSLTLRNNAGIVTTELDGDADLRLGGLNASGALTCVNSAGVEGVLIDAESTRMDFNYESGETRVRIDADDFSRTEWPAWPGERSPSQLDLIAEIRQLKEEVLALKTSLNELTTTHGRPIR
jgi:hypothetical protein